MLEQIIVDMLKTKAFTTIQDAKPDICEMIWIFMFTHAWHSLTDSL